MYNKPTKVLSPEYLWSDYDNVPSDIKVVRISQVVKNYAEVRPNGGHWCQFQSVSLYEPPWFYFVHLGMTDLKHSWVNNFTKVSIVTKHDYKVDGNWITTHLCVVRQVHFVYCDCMCVHVCIHLCVRNKKHKKVVVVNKYSVDKQ